MSVSQQYQEQTRGGHPLAYLISFRCYGTWLQGDARGAVRRQQNHPGTYFIQPDTQKFRANHRRMSQSHYEMNAPRRKTVLDAIVEVCIYRGWELLAAHVRPDHVHVVVEANCKPEKAMNDFKAYASRALTRAGYENSGRKRWSRHGSTRYLWKPEQVEAALYYVLNEQGEPMEVYGLE